jgi:hypothetical protein
MEYRFLKQQTDPVTFICFTSVERTKEDGGGEGDKGSLETPAKGTSGGGGGSGTKRKAESDNATPSKKAKQSLMLPPLVGEVVPRTKTRRKPKAITWFLGQWLP